MRQQRHRVRRARPERRSSSVVRTAAAWLVLLAASCSSASAPESAREPEGLTDAQAAEISLARFSTHGLGTADLQATFTMGGLDVVLTGWVDYPARVAYVQSAEDGVARNLLMWTDTDVALQQLAGGTPGPPPLPQPALDGSWGKAAMDPGRSLLQQILTIILEFGNDRPDNPVLVRQGGARYEGSADVDGSPTNVYEVPPSPGDGPSEDQRVITYWIDASGAIRRASFRLTDGTEVVVSLREGDGPSLLDPFGVGQ